ncbi:MAG: peptidoglycan-binding domain-containing protein [Pseudomonadota bacterium]
MCWASVGEPPVLATLEDEVIVEPPGLAADGTLREDPVTRVSRRELVVTPGTQIWFEILCPAAFTEDRVATLQRALAARGLYTGAITGRSDDQTNAAIRAYQAPLGVDSGALTRAAAERLGLIVTAPTG